MRSIPTEGNPALRASRYAARTSSTEWIRPRAARVGGRNDWTPRLTRLKPPSRSQPPWARARARARAMAMAMAAMAMARGGHGPASSHGHGHGHGRP